MIAAESRDASRQSGARFRPRAKLSTKGVYMRRSRLALVLLALVFVAAQKTSPRPATERKPVTDAYHGVEVVDEYRWLEDAGDKAVKTWVEKQNQYTRRTLDRLPGRAAVEARLRALYTTRPASYFALVERGGRIFALKSQPPKEQLLLVTLPSMDDRASERVILDPVKIAADASVSIDWFEVSHDGRLIAVSLSRAGSELGDLHFYEAATGRKLADIIPRVNGGTALGSVTWNADGSGVYYTRYPREGERPKEDLAFYQQLFFHKLGTPESEDRYELGRDLPRIAEIFVKSSTGARWIWANVLNGDGGEVATYLRRDDGTWKQITTFQDKIPGATIGDDGNFYLISHRESPMGTVLRLPVSRPELSEAETIVAAKDMSAAWLLVTDRSLFVNYQAGGPSILKRFDLDGRNETTVATPPVSAVGGAIRLQGDAIAFANGSFLEPWTWFTFDPAKGEVRKVGMNVTSPINFDDTEVERVMVTSKDGTKVPLNIIKRKGTKRDGNNPLLLTGYGGYGISLTPGFSTRRRLWLDVGGIWAVANLRGGGEFGEAWHKAGNLTNKQNVFDDFAACAKYLIEQRYTSPSKLVIEGGSNGGLLMGAALTQHPSLFRAVVSHVGIYDMLRVELSPNGAFNVPEFGTVKDEAQFRALRAYSPYHNVKNGTKYPAVLMLTGDNDPRVDPMQSRKMVARLHAANSGNAPILLRTDSTTGHGSGTALSKQIAQDTDVWSFVFSQVGIRYEGPRMPAKPSRTDTEVKKK